MAAIFPGGEDLNDDWVLGRWQAIVWTSDIMMKINIYCIIIDN